MWQTWGATSVNLAFLMISVHKFIKPFMMLILLNLKQYIAAILRSRNPHSVSNNNYNRALHCDTQQQINVIIGISVYLRIEFTTKEIYFLLMYLLNDFVFLFFIKVWEKLQADLKTNADGEATWQGCFLLTPSEEKLTSKLANCSIK